MEIVQQRYAGFLGYISSFIKEEHRALYSELATNGVDKFLTFLNVKYKSGTRIDCANKVLEEFHKEYKLDMNQYLDKKPRVIRYLEYFIDISRV